MEEESRQVEVEVGEIGGVGRNVSANSYSRSKLEIGGGDNDASEGWLMESGFTTG